MRIKQVRVRNTWFSRRDLVLKRFLRAGLVGVVFLACFVIGTIISSILFTGIEL
jgi:hypothetical protein